MIDVKRPSLLVFAVAGLTMLACAVAAFPVRVPQQFPTIAQAVEYVITQQPSDTEIRVSGGPYTESITIDSGPPLSIIAGGFSEVHWMANGGPCITVSGSAEVEVHGFIFEDSPDSGILVVGSELYIEDCIIEGSGLHGIKVSGESTVTLKQCIIECELPNETSHAGVCVTGIGASVEVLSSEIEMNRGEDSSRGVCVDNGAKVRVLDTVITNATVGMLVSGEASRGEIMESTLGGCQVALSIVGGTLNAGNLENEIDTDDGRNILHLSNERYIEATVGGSASAEGNIFGRISTSHFASRVSGNVALDPACQLVIDRVFAYPEDVYPRFSDGQWVELRLVATTPSDHMINLRDWQISDDPNFDNGNEGYAVIGVDASLEVGQSALLAMNPTEISPHYSFLPGELILDIGAEPRIVLSPHSGSGDEVFIRPNDYGTMDAIFFGSIGFDNPSPPDWYGPRTSSPNEEETMVRNLESTDTNTAVDWSITGLEGRIIYRPREGLAVH